MVNLKGKFPKDFDSYQSVEPMDMVFCLFDIDETPRTVGLSSLAGMITGAYTVFEVHGANPRYLYYYYLALDEHKQLKPLYTGLRKVISVDTFLRTKVPYPPIEEQEQIARYLDDKVLKINRLIRAKRKQIALLKEQKQVVINHIVTNGLDLHAGKMPSNIEGLGDVPRNWSVKPLKYFVKSNIETLTNSFDGNKIINYIDISTVGFGELKQKPVRHFFKEAPSRARRVIRTGDTIISTVRTYLKSMCYVSEDLDGFIASTVTSQTI
jgi:type I restriction enzyme S subunit